MKISQFVVSINIGKEKYFYNVMTGEYCTNNEILYKKSFWVEDNINEFDKIMLLNKQLKKDSNFLCLTIAVTNQCNFRCTYCFEEHSDTCISEDSIEPICNLIERYCNECKNTQRLVVIWFGGEPLMNLDYILKLNCKIKLLANHLNLGYSGRIITNGYLLENLIPYIKELNLTDIQITLDGMKKLHDSRRRNLDDQGSFDKIISNIKCLKDPINLIIRINIDKYNIDDGFKLYDYICNLYLSSSVTIYFQPILVENFGGESECYSGLMSLDKELNMRFNDLQEYTNTLTAPKFIGAFCNVDFPGNLTISSTGSLNKCWAKINYRNPCNLWNMSSETIFQDILNKNLERKLLFCHKCKILPACMGGCVFKTITKKDCIIRKTIMEDTIRRKIFNEKCRNNLQFAILENEILWLKSIGCYIKFNSEGIAVTREEDNTCDFNFSILNQDFMNQNCIRISSKDSDFDEKNNFLLSHGCQRLHGYDINYLSDIFKENSYNDDNYSLFECTIDEWHKDVSSRICSKYTKFFKIFYNNIFIGKFSAIVTQKIIGIYDFEIFKLYRKLGHGSNILKKINALSSNKRIFIQTWDKNISATKCYQKAGYVPYEKLYRYRKS